jgi:hypothetical protein
VVVDHVGDRHRGLRRVHEWRVDSHQQKSLVRIFFKSWLWVCMYVLFLLFGQGTKCCRPTFL